MQDNCKSLNFKLQNASSSSESQVKEIQKATEDLKKEKDELEMGKIRSVFIINKSVILQLQQWF